MKSSYLVVKNNLTNVYLITRLSLFELRSSHKTMYLGMLWEVMNPLILISIYWFVFGYGIRGGREVDGVAFLPWMLSGIAVWFFISQALIEGSKSIYKRIKIISKMNFPMSVIPTYVIVAKFYQHLLLMAIVMMILGVYGYMPSIYSFQLVYFIIANLALLIAISLITSTLSTIIRDVQMVVQAVVRVLLYVTPILWSVENIPSSIVAVMKLNPLYYIVEGYRSALLGRNWYFLENQSYTLYYWAVVLVLFLGGSVLHMKFQKRFIDYI